MDNQFYMLLDLLIAISGGYIVYQYVLMKKTGEIRQNMLIPKDIDVKKCKDVDGYIRYIGVKQLGFGIAAFVCGALGVVQDYYGSVNAVFSIVCVVIFLGFTVWYAKANAKALDMFWGRGKKK